jgi:predicted RNA-binding protein with PUA-like domain
VKNYWLLKSEPEEFSIDDLERVGREPWSGVRNYQARNYMRDGMKVGDGVLFYHSNCKPPGVVGVAEVVGAAYPDPTQFDPKSDYFDPASERAAPRWLAVDVGYKRSFRRCVTLDELKAAADSLGDLALLRRGNRLSVLPVSAAQWKHILKMEKS